MARSLDRFHDAERRLWESFAVAVTERRVTLPRSGVEVRVQETGSGPPVLFVHGTMSAGSVWAPLARLLPDFRCLLLDRPGCGLSTASTADLGDHAGLEAYADAMVVDVLDALAIERADVVATSFGGYFALRAAAAQSGLPEHPAHHGLLDR